MDSKDDRAIVGTTMTDATVIALIGHSAAGKSQCLKLLKLDRQAADMDVAWRIKKSPTFDQCMDWLTDKSRPPVVVVSNHEEKLNALHSAKLSEAATDLFNSIHFVYFKKSKDRLARHLNLLSAGGSVRCEAAKAYTLQHYDRFDSMFSDLANEVVDCSSLTSAEVAKLVSHLSKQVLAERVRLYANNP